MPEYMPKGQPKDRQALPVHKERLKTIADFKVAVQNSNRTYTVQYEICSTVEWHYFTSVALILAYSSTRILQCV